MERSTTCLDFRARKVNIEANVGDDIRFTASVKIDGVPVLETDFDVETFIFDLDGTDVSDDFNFTTTKLDGEVNFVMEDSVTTEMGPGKWTYAIVITLITQSDYDRSVVNGLFILESRGSVS